MRRQRRRVFAFTPSAFGQPLQDNGVDSGCVAPDDRLHGRIRFQTGRIHPDGLAFDQSAYAPGRARHPVKIVAGLSTISRMVREA